MNRIDCPVVGYVITVIEPWRLVERSDPNGVHAEPLEVLKSLPDAFEITNAVTVGVRK